MPLTIRPATVADTAAIGVLIHAMDVHYRSLAEAPTPTAAAAMAERTLSQHEGTRFLLAFDGAEAVGIACFAVLRPGRSLKGVLYLKDLFTLPAHRSRGVGRALLQALARYAFDHDLGRIEFQTDRTNTGAQKLYDTLDGERLEKVNYRFDGERLARLARGETE